MRTNGEDGDPLLRVDLREKMKTKKEFEEIVLKKGGRAKSAQMGCFSHMISSVHNTTKARYSVDQT